MNNVSFHYGDARELAIDDEYDAILMVDLLHHIDDPAKTNLLETCCSHLAEDGRLVIKDVTTHPFPKIAFTWALDAVMTKSFDMWYWNEERFYSQLGTYFDRVEMYPLVDWLPYPHVIYCCENMADVGGIDARTHDVARSGATPGHENGSRRKTSSIAGKKGV